MEFNLDGLEEFYTDGVLNPRVTSVLYQENCTKYKELGDRVFLLYAPPTRSTDAAGAAGAEFDVVLLHGIGSDEFKCWTNQQGVLWPAVFLPQDFPTARVLTVGYAHSLFSWTAKEASDAVAQVAAVAPDAVAGAAAAGSASPPNTEASAAGKEEEHGRLLRPIKALARKVEQSKWESVSAYAPEQLSEWWRRPAETTPRSVPSSAAASSTHADAATSTPQEHASSSQVPTGAASHENPLFQLLARIRDSTGSLVSAEDGSSSAAHARADGGAQGEASAPSTPAAAAAAAAATAAAAAARDPRSLQSMRLVAAEVAERLLSPAVGVGQRPVVFMVHSMGGLILKQMLISLFEAARLAPPLVAPMSIAGGESAEKALAVQEDTAQADSHAAIQQATTLLRSVRGVVFYGTPHFGSAMASVITGLKKYYQGLGGLNPTSVVTGLGDHNKAELTRLNDRFFDVVERLGADLPFEESGVAAAAAAASAAEDAASAAEFAATMTSSLTPAPASVWSAATVDGGGRDAARCGLVCVLSFGETRKLNGLVRVVEPESANPAPEDPRYPFYLVNADHSEINRPVTKTSPSYAMLYGLLDRMQQRGLLGRGPAAGQTMSTSTAATPPAAALPAPSSSRDDDAVRGLQQRYEAGWATLFEPTPAATAADAKVTAPADAGETASRQSALSTSASTYVRGVGEARLALPLLDSALDELRQLLRRFFGVAVPPQLDAVFLLAADMREFVDGFYSHERLVSCSLAGAAWLEERAPTSPQHPLTSVDEGVSFRVPLQIVLYWARQATRVLRGFEKSRGERAAATAVWEANMLLHPSSRDFRELGELEESVGVVREDWEGFRRYVSLRVRAAAASAVGPVQGTAAAAKPAQPSAPLTTSDEAPVADHIAALFFARTLRAIVAEQLHDGGAIGGLLGAYLRSAVLQVRGAESQLSPAHLENDIWLPFLRAMSRSASAPASASFPSPGVSLVSLLMEGLELAAPSSRTTPDGSVLVDTSGHRVDLTSAAELGAITPALTATSALLMGCFALYVDETHHLDATARTSAAATAAHHFRRATAAAEADGRVRVRLLRAAARLVRRGSPSLPSSASSASSASHSGTGRGDAEWDWWRAARQLTAPRAASPTAGTTAAGRGPGPDVAAALAEEQDQPCSHVGVLDDGLFLSAVQLASAALQCTTVIAACQSRVSVPGVAGAAVPEAELMRAMEVGQKAYERTAKLVRGVLVIEDTEQPFGAARKGTASHTSGGDTDAAEERSAKERFCDTIRSLLRELESDEVAAENEGDAAAANTAQEGKTPTSALPRSQKALGPSAAVSSVKPKSSKRVSSLPMFIMSSLSKAWAAVRRGEASGETPDYFAYNAMVLWWTVEWRAAAVLRASAAALPGSACRQRVHATLAATEKVRQRRWAAASSKGAESEERECWSHANAALRCGLLTLGGADDVMHALHSGLAREQGALKPLLDTTSADALRAAETCAAALPTVTALAHIGGGERTGAQQAVPQVLLDAVRAVDTNAALRCWLGHCYTLHRVASPDAAHAYLQVIRNDFSRAQTHATAAEVGLAWNHLHRVPCASLQLWREGGRFGRSANAATALDAWDVASALLCYDRGAVVDTSALRSAPPALARFFRGAVLHHAEAVRAYALASSPGTSCHPHLKCHPLSTRTPGARDALVGADDAVPDARARHLRFAEEGFQRALHADPRNVGALCGLGRLRSLATSCGTLGGSSTGSWSEGGNGKGSTLSTNNGLGCVVPGLGAASAGAGRAAEASAYFAAALAAAAEYDAAAGHTAALAPGGTAAGGTSHAHALDRVWCSYAAYWMSEECGRDNAADAAEVWLRRAVDFYPRNDWALTSLGLSLLCGTEEGGNDAATAFSPSRAPLHATAQQAAPSVPRVPGVAGAPDADLRAHRGVALLQRALVLNPTNTWALWGVGTYAAASQHRDTCQRLLRHLIVRSLRRRM